MREMIELKRFTGSIIILLLLLILPMHIRAQCTFTNPVMEGADPHVTYYDGYYYMLVTRGDRVGIKRSAELQKIHEYKETVVWRFQNTPAGGHIWAPELHQIDGKWFIYTCGQNTGLSNNQVAVNYVQENQQMLLLESQSDSPLGPYTFKTWLLEGTGAIDETVFTHSDGKQYIIWSQFNEPGQPQIQCNYIAELVNAWTIGDKRVKISCPDQPWERNGWPVNEGATVLQRNGKTYVVYSGSGYTTPGYALGYLLNRDGELLNAGSWTKTGPVFQQNPDGGIYSTGHNSFTTSPDGSEYWNVYHGRLSADGNTSRYVFLQRYHWMGDVPYFGVPVPVGQEIACPSMNRGQINSIHPAADTGTVLTGDPLQSGSVTLWEIEAGRGDYFDEFARFRLVPGLADNALLSLESAYYMGHYLINNEGAASLEPFDGSEKFRTEATFSEVPPWSGLAGHISIESYSVQGSYLRLKGDDLLFENVTADSSYVAKEDATWKYSLQYSLFDCFGDYLGEAFIDSCGVCAGGNTGITPSLDKYDCLQTGAPEVSVDPITVYPNPAGEFLVIEGPYSVVGSDVTIFDVTGRKLAAFSLDDNKIDVTSLNTGLYFLRMMTVEKFYSTLFYKI